MSGDYRGRANRPLTASRRSIQSALDDREEALATLLERPGGPRTLLNRFVGKPRVLGSVGNTSKPVVRVPLKRGVPGEVLDIQLRDVNSTAVDRVFYRCLAISSSDSIESTPREYTATWYAAQLLAEGTKTQTPSWWSRGLRRSTTMRVLSGRKASRGTACRICGRRKLSRLELNWRRRNGYAVWRCQHRRPLPTTRRDLFEAGGVIVGLVLCILVVRL
jgi:hypothetical protein